MSNHFDLLKHRVIFLNEPINAESSQRVIEQLLFLAYEDEHSDITMYINSPGGSIIDGLAIYDTMNYIKCDVATICVGLAASMAAVLLSSGASGKRAILPNSEVMIHEVSSCINISKISDIVNDVERIKKNNQNILTILSKNTNQSIDIIKEDTKYDHFLDAKASLTYGIVDHIL